MIRMRSAVAGPADGNRRRILIIEDDTGIRTLLASALRMSGYDCRGAPDARQARAEIPRFRPDLLVPDVMLPDLDGLALTRQLPAAGSPHPRCCS
jgi:two-component system, OmpR family, response regulator